MQSIYTHEMGIKPWEQIKDILDDQFATITIVQSTVEALASYWRDISCRLLEADLAAIKWGSLAYRLPSPAHEAALLRKLNDRSIDHDCYLKGEATGIYSYLKNISDAVDDLELQELTHARYNLVVFKRMQDADAKDMLLTCQCGDAGVSAETIKHTLKQLQGAIICRAVDNETHATLQFMGDSRQIEVIVHMLHELQVARVPKHSVPRYIKKAAFQDIGVSLLQDRVLVSL